MYDVAIIGAGPAGLQAAIFTQSEGLSTIVFTGGKIGGQIRDTPRLENFAGQNSKGISGPEFVSNMTAQCKAFGVIFWEYNVLDFNPDGQGGFRIWDNGVLQAPGLARSIIVATGLEYKRPPLDLTDLINQGRAFIGPFGCMSVPRGGKYIVMGGGNSAGQAILSLATHAEQVTVLTRSGMGMSKYLVDRIAIQHNVKVYKDVAVDRINSKAIRDTNGVNYRADYFFFCIGGTPRTDFVPSTIERNEKGEIKVDSTFATSLPNCYAIGDCREGNRRHSVGTSIGDAAVATGHLLTALRNQATPNT